jgi:cysteinyl-tRNA synthetase
MSAKYLGENFDIHGGGADLQFPHHENEIAQSCCANPNSHFASFWIHNGFLTVNGEKMSKSLKNFITVRDLLDQKTPGIVIRYLLLSTHYRKPFDFNSKALDDATKSLEKFYSVIAKSDLKAETKLSQEILTYLADDLNISKVTAFLHDLTKQIKASDDQDLKSQMAKILDFLGLFDADFFSKNTATKIDESYVNEQIALRLKFKKEKNFAESDAIRKNLLELGVVLEDVSKEETIWKK